MQFIHTTTHEEITLAQLKERFPLTLFPVDFQGDFEDYAPIHPEAQPAHDASTHKAVKAAPVEVDGQWRQAWEVVELSEGEIAAVRRALVPNSVTMRQARLALLGAGMLPSIATAIAALPSPQKEAAEIEWEYSQEVQRHNGFVSVLAPSLGMTEAQTDALFIAAAGL